MRIHDELIGRTTASEERSIARAIRAAEEEALDAVRGLPEADEVLQARGRRPERTRAGEVDRLRTAVDAVVEAAQAGQVPKDRAAQARLAWDRSHGLRWKLAMSARRVVPPLARQIAGRHGDPDDLVVEGYIGLHRAAERFDPDQGIRFATYARWWARAQMTRAVDRGGRSIRLPGGAVEAQRRLRRIVAQREAAKEPWSHADLANEVGLSEDRVRLLLDTPEVTSLDAPSSDDGDGRPLVNQLADSSAEAADDEAGRMEMLERVASALSTMTDERLKFVLARRFGLDGEEERTLREIGDELGLSRERVRQLEARALGWLREQLVEAGAA